MEPCLFELVQVGGAAPEPAQIRAGSLEEWVEGQPPPFDACNLDGWVVTECETEVKDGAPLRVRSLTGHRVLTPVVSQEELAEDMFGQQ